VSWQSLVSGRSVTVRDSPLESERFGLTFSRIEVPLGVSDDSALGGVQTAVRESEADIVVLRYPAARVGWYAQLLASGRDLISADTLTYWRLEVGRGRPSVADAGVATASAEELDESLVGDLVADMFAGYGNHYLANPLLAPGDALAGYVEWAQRSVQHDTAIALTRGDEGVVGLATLEMSPGTSEIQLAGIRQRFQRHGLYAHLLAGCERAAGEQGAGELVISTQAHNAQVQRAWTRFGFEPVGTVLTVHAVRPGLLPSV
jgi:ribosomal protein S18 acetylase RimI-like enzyme